MKIVVISHTFQKEERYHRWEEFAKTYSDCDITLLSPATWVWGGEKNLTYGTAERIIGEELDRDNFHIRLIHTSKDSLADWTSKDMLQQILKIRPDIVYILTYHSQLAYTQLLHFKNMHKEMKNTKFLCFSMRSSAPTIRFNIKRGSLKKDIRALLGYLYTQLKVKYLNRYADAVFCHYPEAIKAFRREGFKRRIFIQTQVGYDPKIFYKNEQSRFQIREKYGIAEDEFVFGSASRFHYSKGLSEIIQALPETGKWKYLMVGWGRDDEVEKLKNEIADRGLENKIILTGFIADQNEMAAIWNAMDCAIHAPLTTPEWEESFSLALIQAMGTGLPVIGSSSGSVPYQIGSEGIIVPEGNIEAMRKEMLRMINDTIEAKRIGECMYNRAYQCFNIYKLNELFYLTARDLLSDQVDEGKEDMVQFRIARGEYKCSEK